MKLVYFENKPIFFISLFFSSILETLFALSFYFPGSVVLVGVILLLNTSDNSLILPILIIWLGVNVGTTLNYFLGNFFSKFVKKLGHKKIIDSTKNILEKYGNITAFFFSAHPNYIGTLYLVSGLIKNNVSRMWVLSIIGTLLFTILWSYLIINVSDIVLTSEANHTYVLSIILFVLGIILGVYSYAHSK